MQDRLSAVRVRTNARLKSNWRRRRGDVTEGMRALAEYRETGSRPFLPARLRRCHWWAEPTRFKLESGAEMLEIPTNASETSARQALLAADRRSGGSFVGKAVAAKSSARKAVT
jgi:hypothetical protein